MGSEGREEDLVKSGSGYVCVLTGIEGQKEGHVIGGISMRGAMDFQKEKLGTQLADIPMAGELNILLCPACLYSSLSSDPRGLVLVFIYEPPHRLWLLM